MTAASGAMNHDSEEFDPCASQRKKECQVHLCGDCLGHSEKAGCVTPDCPAASEYEVVPRNSCTTQLRASLPEGKDCARDGCTGDGVRAATWFSSAPVLQRRVCRVCWTRFCYAHCRPQRVLSDRFGSFMVSACDTCFEDYCRRGKRVELCFPDDNAMTPEQYALAVLGGQLLCSMYRRPGQTRPLTVAIRKQTEPCSESVVVVRDGDGRAAESVSGGLEFWRDKGATIRDCLEAAGYRRVLPQEARDAPAAQGPGDVRLSSDRVVRKVNLDVFYAGAANQGAAHMLSDLLDMRMAVDVTVCGDHNGRLLRCTGCKHVRHVPKESDAPTSCPSCAQTAQDVCEAGYVEQAAAAVTGVFSWVMGGQEAPRPPPGWEAVSNYFAVQHTPVSGGLPTPLASAPLSTPQRIVHLMGKIRSLQTAPVEVERARLSGYVYIPCGHHLLDYPTDPSTCPACGTPGDVQRIVA